MEASQGLIVPWDHPAQWRAAQEALRYHLVKTPHGFDAAREFAGSIRQKRTQLAPLLEPLCHASCPWCPEPCCLTARPWFDFRDLLYCLLSDLPLPPTQVLTPARKQCVYSSPKGCRLPREIRPWICTWYICPTQIQRLDKGPSDLRTQLENIRLDIKLLRIETEKAFIDTVRP